MKLRSNRVIYRLITTNEQAYFKKNFFSCFKAGKCINDRPYDVRGKQISIFVNTNLHKWKYETSEVQRIRNTRYGSFDHHYHGFQERKVLDVANKFFSRKEKIHFDTKNVRKKIFTTKVQTDKDIRNDSQTHTNEESTCFSQHNRTNHNDEMENTNGKFSKGVDSPTNGTHHTNGVSCMKEEHVNMIQMMKKKKIKTAEKEEGKIIRMCSKGANGMKLIFSFFKKFGKQMKIIILQPSMLKVYYSDLKKNIKHTVVWVKTGVLLFLTNMKISKNLIIKRLKGHRLSYSEYKLLIRTMNDMFKLIPFSFFIIVPFAEFLLPLFLKIYPNLLPSTFKNNDDNFMNIKKNLYAKQQLAKFLQQLIEEKEKQLNENIGIDSEKKKQILIKFHQQLINKDEKDINPFLSVADTLKIAKIFKEDFVLDQMNLKTLQTICHLLGLKPYGIHYHVVLQLRHHFLRLQREDRELIYEGVDNLKKNTLIEICKDRGMNFNTTEKEMKLQIQQWLELASIKEVPYILLLYIRCVVVTHAIMDIQDENKVNSATSEKDTKNSNMDDKQKLIQEAKEKLDDLKMKEQEIKKNINKETNEEEVLPQHSENKIKMDFLKKNKYLQNELNMLKQICDLQHTELKIAFTSLTDLAERKQSYDINEVIKNMSQRLLDIEKHISELNAHKQVEMDEYFYPEEEKADDVVDVKN
ncbi:hypothetical protein, conserved [Plasmodium gonderi]|uniref:Letm1 RBD domain-containing protein n=1 Tax=Plasmodium gonderi TaxID=77519 RepID=A0A1Y1JF10_PLAGO|nr:hypothetical protein, conserved [Plasmodium gonderi]GAW79797.1 hypothetical protein, conserved [Plasmodium gonderi]